MNELKTINNNAVAEIVEKKSKFIANIFYVQNEEEVNFILKDIKKQFFDAKHHCFAYRIINDENIIQRSSDDGEPSGTAGKPILTILEKNQFVNVLVVVTRYFGGILLGTGGLVKAYTDATLLAIEKSECVNIELGYEVNIKLQYQELEKFKYFCKINNIKIKNEEFYENVNMILEVSEQKLTLLNNFFDKNIKSDKINLLSKIYIKNKIQFKN